MRARPFASASRSSLAASRLSKWRPRWSVTCSEPSLSTALAFVQVTSGVSTRHTDRLVRLTEELDRVIKVEVPVHTVTAGDLDLSTPAGRAVARTITAWAR